MEKEYDMYVPADETIDGAACALIHLAKLEGRRVTALFNGFELAATADMRICDVVGPYDERAVKIGALLYSTCGGENFGKIVGVEAATVDVNPTEWLMDCIGYRPVDEEGDEERASDFDWNGNVELVLRKVPFRFIEESIALEMPLTGCFRCTQCFDLVEDGAK